eukprot:UN01204
MVNQYLSSMNNNEDRNSLISRNIGIFGPSLSYKENDIGMLGSNNSTLNPTSTPCGSAGSSIINEVTQFTT